MNWTKSGPLVALAFAGCGGVFSPDEPETIDAGRLQAHVEFLAADSMYGRRAGSVHERRAAEYIRDAFTGFGVTPAVTGYFQSFPIDGGKFPVGRECSASPSQTGDTALVSQNVIGSIPGLGRLAGQWVVVTAHYDHLGCTGSGQQIDIYNGADDNASGTATMMEIARLVAADPGPAQRNRRSIMFQAVGTEEPGLLGSAYYVAHATVSLDSVVAVINLDMVGRLRNNTLTVVGTSRATGWEAIVEGHNDDNLSLRYDDSFVARGDHWSYLAGGVPAIALFTGTHSAYHTPEDDVEFVDFGGAVIVGNLALRLVRALSLQSQMPVYGS